MSAVAFFTSVMAFAAFFTYAAKIDWQFWIEIAKKVLKKCPKSSWQLREFAVMLLTENQLFTSSAGPDLQAIIHSSYSGNGQLTLTRLGFWRFLYHSWHKHRLYKKNQTLQNHFLISVTLRWHRVSVACKNQSFKADYFDFSWKTSVSEMPATFWFLEFQTHLFLNGK